MKQPTKKLKIIEKKSDLLLPGCEYTPKSLREIADLLEEDNIFAIEIRMEGYDSYSETIVTRYETQEEAEFRYNREREIYKKYLAKRNKDKERRKADLIKEAKKLGLTLNDKS